jgi:PIN domain nuclease of toxin-antitoxin system
VKVLIDTNALIWWLEDDMKLGPRGRALIAAPSTSSVASIVSIWEITMKWRIGKYPNSGAVFLDFLADEGVDVIGITPAHLRQLELVEAHHKDPFDHLLIAQAQVEGARILTSDREMTHYGVPCFPAGR